MAFTAIPRLHIVLPTRTLWLLSLLLLTLVLIPLAGLWYAISAPPASPLLPASVSLPELWQQTAMNQLLYNTLALTFFSTLAACSLGVWFAWVHKHYYYLGRNWLNIGNLCALAMPSFLLAVTLRQGLSPGGWLGQYLGGGAFYGFWPSVLVLTIISTPYVQLIVAGVLQRIGNNEQEQARLLGAPRSTVFWRIGLAPLRPAIALSGLIAALYTISDFGAVAVLDLQVLTWRLYQSVAYQQLAQAGVIGGVLLLITFPLLILSRYIHGRMPHQPSVAHPRPIVRRRLRGIPLVFTYSAHALIIGCGLIIPLITLLVWITNSWQAAQPFAPIIPVLRTTLWVAGGSALVIVLLAIPPAWLVARRPTKRTHILEQGLYATSALPGILLAFGLLLAALGISRSSSLINYSTLLYSGILLLLGYIMRFINEAYAAIKPGIVHFDPRLSDNARLLGASPWSWLRHIAWPQLRHNTQIAYALVFLGLIKELPITLLLGGAMGIHTLSFRIFDRYEEAFLNDAGLAGLILMIITLTLVSMTLKWRGHGN